MNAKKENEKNKNVSLNIYQKLQVVQKEVKELVRDKKNKGQNYFFFTERQVLQLLKPLLDENKLVILISDDENKEFTCEKSGNMFLVRYWKKAEIINVEKPEEKSVHYFAATGQNNDPAKAKGSAETYAIKYLLSKFFLIPVEGEDDPDYYPKEKIPDKETTLNHKSANLQTITHSQVEELYQLFVNKRGQDINKQTEFFKQIDQILEKETTKGNEKLTGKTNTGNFRNRLANLSELDYQELKEWLNNLK